MATWTWIGDQREVKMMRTVSGSVCSHSYKRHESGCGDLFDGSKVSGAWKRAKKNQILNI